MLVALGVIYERRGASSGRATAEAVSQPRLRRNLVHRPHETENTRTYTYFDDQLQEVEVRFTDGALGRLLFKGTTFEGKPKLASAEESHDNKRRYKFELGADGRVQTVVAYDKDGALRFKDVLAPKFQRTYYQADGQALLATVEVVSASEYVFVAYQGQAGGERKVYQEVYTERKSGGGHYGMMGGGAPTINFESVLTVWNGGTTPHFRQFWRGTKSGAERVAPVLERVEYFDLGSRVTKRVYPNASFELGGVKQTGFEVSLVSNDKITSTRYVTGDGRLVKVIDQLKPAGEPFTVPADAVFNEAVNSDHLKPYVDEAMARLLAECFASDSGYLHMDRLLVQ